MSMLNNLELGLSSSELNKYSKINDIKIIYYFIKNVYHISNQYKKICSDVLMEFRNIICFDNKLQKIYDDTFNEINNDLFKFYRDNILYMIIYTNNIIKKYNIETKINSFGSPNFVNKEYEWIDDLTKFTVRYSIYDLGIILNSILQQIILLL